MLGGLGGLFRFRFLLVFEFFLLQFEVHELRLFPVFAFTFALGRAHFDFAFACFDQFGHRSECDSMGLVEHLSVFVVENHRDFFDVLHHDLLCFGENFPKFGIFNFLKFFPNS